MGGGWKARYVGKAQAGDREHIIIQISLQSDPTITKSHYSRGGRRPGGEQGFEVSNGRISDRVRKAW